MAKIFVSYSRADTKTVNRLIEDLEAVGFQVWVDRSGIRGGEIWRQEIVEAIVTSDAMVLVLSNHSVESDNVRKEVDLAELRKLRILPVEIEPTTITPEFLYQLVGIQRIELFKDYNQGLNQLLGALGQKRPPPPVQPKNRLLKRLLSQPSKFVKRNRRTAAILAVITLFLLSVAGYLGVRRGWLSQETGTCPPIIGQQIHIPEGVHAWEEPRVSDGGVTRTFDRLTPVYIIDGREWGIISYGTEIGGWWWEISVTANGNSLGWVWEGQMEECK